jgi:hypothetical protein
MAFFGAIRQLLKCDEEIWKCVKSKAFSLKKELKKYF